MRLESGENAAMRQLVRREEQRRGRDEGERRAAEPALQAVLLELGAGRLAAGVGRGAGRQTAPSRLASDRVGYFSRPISR